MHSVKTWITEHRPAAAVMGVGALTLIGVLGWLFQPWQLFLDTEVSEDFPVVTAAPSAAAPSIVPSAIATDDEARAVPSESMAPDEQASEPMPTEPVLLASGTFMDRSHPTSGTVGLYELPDGSHVLRIEDLVTDNGPDLFVYLSTAAADAPVGEFEDEFANLGRLKGNLGDQNYPLLPDVDHEGWTSVVIWCDRFTVAFGTATLTPA